MHIQDQIFEPPMPMNLLCSALRVLAYSNITLQKLEKCLFIYFFLRLSVSIFAESIL